MGVSAVAPSISSALDWLNKCVSERPNLRLQVWAAAYGCTSPASPCHTCLVGQVVEMVPQELAAVHSPLHMRAHGMSCAEGGVVIRAILWSGNALECLSFAPDLQVLVTGSLYLVGDVLKHLKKFI